MTTRRLGRHLLSLVVLVLAAVVLHDAFVAPKIPNQRHQRPERQLHIARLASETEDSVEISGFSGFVVGLAFLPYTCSAVVTAFNVIRGESFPSFGLELLSCVVSIGLVLWSVGSFLQRGRGLPAGPLGLLGLSEGVSYLAALGLAAATVAAGVRSGPSLQLPPAPQISMPSLPQGSSLKVPNLPNVKVPDFKVPDIKVPDVKVPDIKGKLPDIKVPDIKVPDIKVPDIKVPDVKVPDIKVPEVKVPDIKVPKPEVKAPEAPKAPKKEAKPAAEADFSSLFD